MIRNRLYTKDEVLQVVEAALNAFDNTEAPLQEPEHLDNDIPQKSSPVNAKVTLTVPEAAELIGICKPTMYEMVRAGKVRSVKVGKKILISRQSLMDWLKEKEIPMRERANGEGSIRKRSNGTWEARVTVGVNPENREADQQECVRQNTPKKSRGEAECFAIGRAAGGSSACCQPGLDRRNSQ